MKGQIFLKSERMGYFYCWIVCMGMIMHGYCLTMLSACDMADIIRYYNLTLKKDTISALFNGAYALGGMTAAIFSLYFLKLTTKVRCFYILTIGIIIANGVMLPAYFSALLIGRFMLGVICSLSIGVAGAYLKQTFSERLRKTFGAIYSLSRMIGSEICYLLGYFIRNADLTQFIVFYGVSSLALLQLVLVLRFLPNIPVEMLSLQNFQVFSQTMQIFYNQKDIPDKIKEIEKQEEDMKKVLDPKNQIDKYKIITALHCGLLRQFCGAPYLIVYCTIILKSMGSPYPGRQALIFSSVQMGGGIIGLFLVQKFMRSKMVIFSTSFGAIFCFLIAVANELQQAELCFIFMLIYIIPCSSCLQSVAWFYPFEVTGPIWGRYAAFLSWFGTLCIMVIPPFITANMSDGASYPIFIFFGIYMCVSLYVDVKYFISIDKPQINLVKQHVGLQLAEVTKRNKLHESFKL